MGLNVELSHRRLRLESSMKSKISNGSLFLDHHSRTGEMFL